MSGEVENGNEATDPRTVGVPPVVRTISYLLGALGFVVLIVGGVPEAAETGAKIAVGLASILGFTYNPSFGVGSKS